MSISKPTGVVQGDVMLCYQTNDWGTEAEMTAAGWTQEFATATGTNVMHAKVWSLVAGASEPASYSFGTSSSADNGSIGSIIALRGATLTGKVQASSSSASTTHVAPTLTTLPSPASGILLCYANTDGNNSALSWTPPGGMTEAADIQQSSLWTSHSVAYLLAPSDPTGTKTFTQTGTPGSPTAWTFSLFVPASSGTVTTTTSIAVRDRPMKRRMLR